MATVQETTRDFDSTPDEATIVYKLLSPDSDEVKARAADPENPTLLERLHFFTEHKVERDDGRPGGFRPSKSDTVPGSKWRPVSGASRNLRDDFNEGKASAGL